MHVNTAPGSNEFTAVNAGRKGMAYDWQSLYAASMVDQLDEQLRALTPAHAE